LKDKSITLIIYGRGGHKEQMKRLLSMMKSHADFDFISISDTEDNFDSLKHFRCSEPRGKFSVWKAPFQLANNAITTLVQCISILKKFKAQGLISTGPGMVVLPALIFKLLGKKVVFLESWSRFYTPSLTGRIMYYVADTFYIQNETLQSIYPKAIFAGRL